MSIYTDSTGLSARAMLRINEGPVTLADGGSQVFDIRNCDGLHIIAGAGATVTYSKVDTIGAGAHDTQSDATTTTEATASNWAFIRVSTAGGSCRCCVI